MPRSLSQETFELYNMIWAVHTQINTFIDSWVIAMFKIKNEHSRREYRDDTIVALEKFIEAIKLMDFDQNVDVYKRIREIEENKEESP